MPGTGDKDKIYISCYITIAGVHIIEGLPKEVMIAEASMIAGVIQCQEGRKVLSMKKGIVTGRFHGKMS